MVQLLERRERIVVGASITLILYTLTLSALGPVVSSAFTNRTISNAGSVKAVGVGVYWDAGLTNKVSSIDWGLVEPGSNENASVYVRNEGNSIVNLTLSTSNWNPSNASTYMTLTWDYGGQSLSVGEAVQVTLTLWISSNIQGITNFSFDIVIMASG